MKNVLRPLILLSLGLAAVLAAQAQPANDNFANAVVLSGTQVSTSGNSASPSNATREDGEPWILGTANIGGRSVWFDWTAPVSAQTRIDTAGSSFNTLLGVYTGATVSTLTQVAANDNGPNLGQQSQVEFAAVQGTTYHIVVDGRGRFGGGASGPYNLNLQVLSVVSITSPTNGTLFALGAPITITAAVVGATLTRMDFYNGSSFIGSDTDSPYSLVLSNAPLGTNRLIAVGVSASSGSLTSAVVNVTVMPSGLSITDPTDGTLFPATNLISVTAVGLLGSGAITNVDFYADKQFFSQDSASPFTANWTSVSPGVHSLTAIGKGDAGNLYTSAPVYISVRLTIVPSNSVWKYLDTGTDLSNVWTALTFDDSSWAAGPAELGYGDEVENPPRPEATVVSYGPDSFHKYIPTYFRRSFVITNAASYTNLIVNVLRDDGAVVYLNGIEVARFNMPTGPITFTNLAPVNATD